MKLLGSLLASALLSLGLTHLTWTGPDPQFRGPMPPRRKRKPNRYGAGLVQPQRRRDQARMEKLHPLRDEHGAYTLVGRPRGYESRRVWLAGVSAQRGF